MHAPHKPGTSLEQLGSLPGLTLWSCPGTQVVCLHQEDEAEKGVPAAEEIVGTCWDKHATNLARMPKQMDCGQLGSTIQHAHLTTCLDKQAAYAAHVARLAS